MTGIKNFLHRSTIAKSNFNKSFKKTGVSFKEYCDYLYLGAQSDKAEIVSSNIYGVFIEHTGAYAFMHSVEEVLADEIYKFESDERKPVIIDCGASIGLSIIYFKKQFPDATIIAFEPDKKIYDLCKRNIEAFKLTSVDVVEAAVWVNEGSMVFLPDNSLGGKVISQEDSIANKLGAYEIKTVRLKDYIKGRIDFLKIDIEGAELEVLKDIKNELKHVQNLFVEYHSDSSKPQNLNELLELISIAGFRYYIKPAMDYMKFPFIESSRRRDLTFDLQLNIFAFKENRK